jgi:hypothetical protein
MALTWDGRVLLIKQNKIGKGTIQQKRMALSWGFSTLKIKAKENRIGNDSNKNGSVLLIKQNE